MPGFLAPLRLEYLDGRKWLVLEPFTYHLRTPHGSEWVEVEAGFLTDFASVPRVLWRVLPPTGLYGKAAVIHDKLYVAPWVTQARGERPVSRAEADAIFLEAMEVLGVPPITRRTMWAGVRVGGWQPWRRYRTAETA